MTDEIPKRYYHKQEVEKVYFSCREAAKMIGVSDSTLRKWVEKYQPIPKGQRLRVTKEQISRLLRTLERKKYLSDITPFVTSMVKKQNNILKKLKFKLRQVDKLIEKANSLRMMLEVEQLTEN